MQLPRAIITSKLEKCLKITHLPTSSKKSDKKGKIAIRIFFSFPTKFPIATLSIIWKLHLAVYRFSRIPVEQIQTHQDIFIFTIVTRPSRQAMLSFWLFPRKSVSKYCFQKPSISIFQSAFVNFDPKQCTCAVESPYCLCITFLILHSSFQTAREAIYNSS